MNLVRQLIVKYGARTDARSGLASVEDRIIAELGPRPNDDPFLNPRYADAVRVLGDRARMEELREDLTRAEDSIGDTQPPILYSLGLILAIGVEALGAVLVLRSLGFPPVERLWLGVGLTIALVLVTAVVARRTSGRGDASPPASAGAKIGRLLARSAGTLVALAAYALLIAAIAAIRWLDASAESESVVSSLANPVLLVAIAVAPAWAVEMLMRKRAPASAARVEARRVRGRLGEAERAHKRAHVEVGAFARKLAQWDREAASRRALYQTHHRLEAAKDAAAAVQARRPLRSRS
ncbi:MAG: hypothetical protein M3020_02510 [Myxococcota bacterium]|nr:hypothetical protein [Myxococcota bacterium]